MVEEATGRATALIRRRAVTPDVLLFRYGTEISMRPNKQTTDELLRNALAALVVIVTISFGARLVEMLR